MRDPTDGIHLLLTRALALFQFLSNFHFFFQAQLICMN